MKVSAKNRQEQDYWLSFSDYSDVTEEERLDFLRYDSCGGPRPERCGRLNPILLGKIRQGQCGEVLRDAYYSRNGSWVGGIALIDDYIEREPFQFRPLLEWFGDDAVIRWLDAWVGSMEVESGEEKGEEV